MKSLSKSIIEDCGRTSSGEDELCESHRILGNKHVCVPEGEINHTYEINPKENFNTAIVRKFLDIYHGKSHISIKN